MAHIMRNIHIIVITTAGRIVDLTGHHFAFYCKNTAMGSIAFLR